MKESSHSLLKPVLLTASALVVSLFALQAQQRIVIEGGPGKIRISDQDGRPEAVTPGAATTAVNPREVYPQDTNPQSVGPLPTRGIIMRAPGTGTADLTGTGTADLTPPRTRAEIDAGTGEEIPETEPQQPTLELTKIMQLARYQEDLGIAESALESRITFAADALFDAGETTINSAAELSLDTLAKYMELSDRDKATVSYRFAPGKETPRFARERSQSLISYFTDEADAASTTFEVLTPEVLEEPVTEDGRVGEARESFESLVEISLR